MLLFFRLAKIQFGEDPRKALRFARCERVIKAPMLCSIHARLDRNRFDGWIEVGVNSCSRRTGNLPPCGLRIWSYSATKVAPRNPVNTWRDLRVLR